MRTPPLVGFCGPEGAGKSESARIAARILGAEVRPFAAPLKRMLVAAGVPERHVYGSEADKDAPLDVLCGRSARHAMQTLGTEWRDTIGRDLWVRLWTESIGPAGAVADDCRFEHEARAIRSRGGVVICVVRSLDQFNRVPQHASEDFASVPRDYLVLNDQCKNLLEARINATLRKAFPDSFRPAPVALAAARRCL